MGCSALGCKVGDFHVGGAISMTNDMFVLWSKTNVANPRMHRFDHSSVGSVVWLGRAGGRTAIFLMWLRSLKIPEETSSPVSPVVPGNSLMDWIYGPTPSIGSVWRKC